MPIDKVEERMNSRIVYTFLCIICLSGTLWAQNSYDMAVEAYRESDLDRALQMLDKAAVEQSGRDDIYVLRGIIQQKKGQLQQAEQTFQRGRELLGPQYNRLTLNLANLYVVQGRQEEAVDLFSLILEGDLAAPARLNRANLYVEQLNFRQAISDYQTYLRLDPTSPQRANIEQLIALLQKDLDDQAEQERLAAERARMEEEARLAAEREAAAEAARKQALLDEIMAALEETGDNTENISADSENIETDTEESDILD